MKHHPLRRTPAFTRFARYAVAGAAMLVAYSAQAGVDPTIIPMQSQVGSLEIPYSCSFPVIGAQTLIVKLTGSMATNVSPGQTFYMTDGSGYLQFPQPLVDLMANVLGITSASGSVTALNLNIANGTPATINALSAPINVSGIPVAAGKPAGLALPPTGFLQVGPLVAGPKGQVLVKMGSAAGVLKLYNKSGGQILFDLGVSCTAPKPEIIALGMTVDGAPTSEISAPHTNIRVEDLATPLNTQSGSLRFPLSCDVQGLGRRQLSATFTGTAPALYAPGEQFNAATGGYGVLQVPGSVVSELLAQAPSVTTAGGAINVLEFSSTNTVPALLNIAASKSIPTARVNLVAGQEANVRIPDTGTLTIGPWKANYTGTDTALYVARTGGTLNLNNAAGQLVTSRTVACDVPKPAVTIVSVTIGGTAVYSPTIWSVSPNNGSMKGGNTVYIWGTNFTNARGVSFGSVPAASFKVQSANLITAVVPAEAAGQVDVSVTGVAGPNATVAADHYTFK